MSALVKQQRIALVPDSAGQELWRVAESGEVDELARVLSRGVDVNERNEHGMTALMRAAYHGHAEMVRALLDHGADPNLTRNDKFTALALAAFFGHTEAVRILLEHGARREVVTRCGASAHMWATARTFADAARCLEAPSPPSPMPAVPVVVKTLKDPPEIWDLVHEVRPSFNAGSVFMARIKSINRVLAIGMFAALMLIVAASVGMLMLRGSSARNAQPVAEIPVIQNVQVSVPTETPKTDAPVSEPEPVVVESNHPRTVTRQIRTRFVAARSEAVEVVKSTESSEAAPVAAAPVATTSKLAAEPVAKKPTNVVSPQLMTPAKAKVIQWP